MRPSRFHTDGDRILQAVRAGRSMADAAREIGLSASTIRSWRKRHPEFRAALEKLETDATEDGEMTLVELESHLVTLIRTKRPVEAMKLWLQLHPEQRDTDTKPEPSSDPLAEIIDLAKRRAAER